MERTTNPMIALALLTLTDSREAARRLRAIHIPRQVLWEGFALVVIASVLLTELVGLALYAGGVNELLRLGPWGAVALQGVFLFVMVHAIHGLGAAFGGTGGFDDSLKLIVWLQGLLVVFQAVQVVVMLVMPGLSGILGLIATGWFFWVLTSFIMVLHGFQSRGKVFAGVLAAFVLFALVMSMILTGLGIIEIVPGEMQ